MKLHWSITQTIAVIMLSIQLPPDHMRDHQLIPSTSVTIFREELLKTDDGSIGSKAVTKRQNQTGCDWLKRCPPHRGSEDLIFVAQVLRLEGSARVRLSHNSFCVNVLIQDLLRTKTEQSARLTQLTIDDNDDTIETMAPLAKVSSPAYAQATIVKQHKLMDERHELPEPQSEAGCSEDVIHDTEPSRTGNDDRVEEMMVVESLDDYEPAKKRVRFNVADVVEFEPTMWTATVSSEGVPVRTTLSFFFIVCVCVGDAERLSSFHV